MHKTTNQTKLNIGDSYKQGLNINLLTCVEYQLLTAERQSKHTDNHTTQIAQEGIREQEANEPTSEWVGCENANQNV